MQSDFKKLGEICLKITDGSHFSPKEMAGGIPMYSVKDMTPYGFSDESVKRISDADYETLKKSDCAPKHGDVLIAKDGSVLKHVFSVERETRSAILSSIAILRPNTQLVDSKYLSYALQDPTLRSEILANYVSGSGVPRIVLKDFKEISIRIPDLRSQKAAAKILGAIDNCMKSKIDLTKKYELLAQCIFRSWFIDFDPVKAKMSGKQPVGLNSSAASLFPDSMFQSEIGLIPTSWSVKTIGAALSVSGGTTPSTANGDYWGGDHLWTTPKDLSVLESVLSNRSSRKLTDLGLKSISSGAIPKHSVIMSCRAPIGYLAINSEPTAVNQGCITLANSQLYPPFFVLNWLRANMQEIKARAGGTTFEEISRTSFKDLPFLNPGIEVLAFYASISNLILELIAITAKCIETLNAIKEDLLPRLMSGELQIPEEMLES